MPARIIFVSCAVAVVMIAAVSLYSVGGKGRTPGHRNRLTRSGAPLYGLSTVGLSFPFAAAIAKGFEEAGLREGVQVIVLDAKASVQKQANDIDDLLAQRPAGIAIMPLDSVVAQSWVERAARAGIPVVAVAAMVGDPHKRRISDVYPGLVALASQDEIAAGNAAGALAADLLSSKREAKIAIIEGASGFPEVEQRARGFTEGLSRNGVQFEVVARQPGNWTSEGGEIACQNILTAHPDIDLFFNEADDMVIGCARAVRSASAAARLIGVGGSRLAIASIKAGAVDGTVCFKPEAMGAMALEALIRPPAAGGTRFLTYTLTAITRSTVHMCVGQW